MKGKLIPYSMIIAAKNGDTDAMHTILAHNARRIDSSSRRMQLDEYGSLRSIIDPEIKDRIVAKLIDRIILILTPTDCQRGKHWKYSRQPL